MAGEKMPSLTARGVTRAGAFAARPPSPPYIHIPPACRVGKGGLTIVPTFANLDSRELGQDELSIITQGRNQMAADNSHHWKYESRRTAQPVLDFLYLGPSSVARDRDFLRKEGITMLLAARDARLAEARLMSVERTAKELGLAADYIDVSSRQELIRAFPLAVQKINDHLIQQYRSQAVRVTSPPPEAAAGAAMNSSSQPPEREMMIDSASFRPGKVLVFCETGNERSAVIVAAYIMAMFNSDLVKTLQFVNLQRFCVSFDDESKFLLRSYEDIINAQRAVHGTMGQPQPNPSLVASERGLNQGQPTAAKKRNIDDTMDVDDEDAAGDPHNFRLDGDRYVGRDPFAPFVDGFTQRGMDGFAGGDVSMRQDG